ncbi:hypothetical protein F4801DRAFT_112161 [Xylaria longipes]|nr:hypothetical protein F4801DRAFT_112161 [Xylaria longipes]
MSGNNPFARLVGAQTPGKSRLAVLEPSDEQNAPIKLTLIDADLKETSYECISYERAKNANIVKISVNDEDYDIPQALESALRTFRRKEKPRTLWADLLVARTAEERSSQATAIRQILENADKTLCWLGPDQELTPRAFDVVHEMANWWSQACVHVNLSQDVGLRRVTIKQMDGIRAKLNESEFAGLTGIDFDFRIWNELYDIFGSLYWSSVQRIPEIVLAKDVVVVCGRSNIRWHNYIGASRTLPFLQGKYQKVPLLPKVMKAFTIVNSIEVAERRRRLGESIELFPMVQTARDCEAQDPRDYVFSMIPISTTPSARVKFHNAGPQPLPTVDYSKSIQEVFIDTARYTVLDRQDLLLWFGERVPCAKRVKDLPSWVPDFSAGEPPGHRRDPNAGLREWWETVQPRKNIRVSDDNALLVQAYALDRVEHVSLVFDAGNFASLFYEEFQKLPDPVNETIEQRDERFWRTLLMNHGTFGESFAESTPPSAAMGASFQSIIAQETVLKLLGCTPNQLPTPEIQARMQTMPEVMALFPKCGNGQYFAAKFCKQSVGRRFFRTKGGRFGMTAVEDVVCLDPKLEAEERKARGLDGEGDSRHLARMLVDPMARMMMDGFQQFLEQRDPTLANVMAQAQRGEFPPQQEDHLSKRGGVSKGDIIVALIGGFFPYILRPRMKAADDGADEGSSDTVVSDSDYEFVGDCYLYGSMDGEDFKVKSWVGTTHYKTDISKIVDIRIV